MTLLLHQDVYACRTDDGAVFLDLRDEQYSGLPQEQATLLSEVLAGWPTDTLTAGAAPAEGVLRLRSELLACGLLVDSPAHGKRIEFISNALNDAIPFRGTVVPRPRIAARDITAFVLSVGRAVYEMRFRKLRQTALRVRNRRQQAEATRVAPNRDLDELVRIFRRLTPLAYTAQDACLFDSIALLEFLARYGHYPQWLLGVRSRPFGAHSWIQHEARVLNDQLERVDEYTPIIVV